MKQLDLNEIRKKKKGEIGEERVARVIKEKGYYEVIHVGGAVKYSIDGTRFGDADLLPYGKGNTFWVQVKYKDPRHFYHDTGLELWRFKRLQKLEEDSGMPVLLIFTDNSGRIYGDWIDRLPEDDKKHGNTWNSKEDCQMIYFWLRDLKDLVILLRDRYVEGGL